MPTILFSSPGASFNTSVEQGGETTYERIPVRGQTLLECILNYGLAKGTRIEPSDRAPVFRVVELNIIGEYGYFACRVRRGSKVIHPKSFDWVIEEADEIEIELLIC